MPQMRKKGQIDMNKVEFDTKNPTTVKRQKALRAEKREQRKKFRIIRNVILVLLGLGIVGFIAAYIYFYSTDAFPVTEVQVNGVEHLTDDEIAQLTDIPEETTLLKVDTDTIIKRLKRDAWIQDVDIVLSFPNTLVINVTEREITAIVEVPTSESDSSKRNWAISADHMWLMPIPDKNSEAAKNINSKIYEDVEGVMHVVEVSPSVQPDIGSYCSDDPVNNAIDVVAAMTTDLKTQVKNVKASDANSTNLFLNNGVEIAVGTSEDLREKERVAQELLAKYEGKISYINVRNANNPTWRSI